ncbi:hypothetical protein PVL29_000013 [Vitis rotundifolia]|uniref:YABBY N-terminal domain-containing protein n=1 Tax=Vitis rotundifolia TaxID=103349 RepID=A0AA39E8M0_VITRO|nr:hypothetical protein PVL29_000013 [Vitis rotundifolia]
MDLVPPSEHLCYVRCNFCNTVLAVGIPCKRLLDTVTVKCGHCSNLSFLSTRPPLQGQCLDHQMSLQGVCNDFRKGQSSSSSSSTSSEPVTRKKTQTPICLQSIYEVRRRRKYNASKQPILRYPIERRSVQQRKMYIPNSPAGSVSESSKKVSRHGLLSVLKMLRVLVHATEIFGLVCIKGFDFAGMK